MIIINKMRLRSGIVTDQRERLNFEDCCINQSLLISRGISKEIYGFFQIKEESRPLVSKISKLGFIPVESMDYPEKPEIKIHSHIRGFIRLETLRELKKWISVCMPGFALIHHIVLNHTNRDEEHRLNDNMKFPVEYFQHPDSNRQGFIPPMISIESPKATRQGFNMYHMDLYMPQDYLDWMKESVQLDPDEPVEFVTLFDMQPNIISISECGLFYKLYNTLSTISQRT